MRYISLCLKIHVISHATTLNTTDVFPTFQQMQLEFDTSNFHVGSYNGNTCANDYISLASGNYNPVHFCGGYAPVGPFIMNGPVTLWFHTSNMAPSTGWYMSYISYTSNGK